jgi:hypothetical protein
MMLLLPDIAVLRGHVPSDGRRLNVVGRLREHGSLGVLWLMHCGCLSRVSRIARCIRICVGQTRRGRVRGRC